SASVRLVAEYRLHAGTEGARARSVDERLEIRTFAGDEHDNAGERRLAQRMSTCPCGSAITSPICHACSPLPRKCSSAEGTSAAATTTIMPMPQLKVRCSS